MSAANRKRALSLRPGVKAEVPRSAMVMAAGLGKRMRPLTVTRPKPLVDLAGKPMIDHVFDRLRAAGVGQAVVNVHYLPDALEGHLETVEGLDISVSDERDLLLETGGGLKKALPLIESDPFISVNSDNFWLDGPSDSLKLLAAHWDEKAMDALLLLVPHARAFNHAGRGDFHLDTKGRVSRRGRNKIAPYVFTGIQIVSKRLLRDAPDGPFSTNVLWDRAIEEGRLYGTVHQGLWFDVGRPQSILDTEAVLRDE
ncbi:nucleotidyltransferase family protein [Sphingomicrobium nitratireducens]|uniref:nucleotidyltransferase family protein n=1 Tax=Sphingomicrobium nitratireducens TaxID=2964666 RepID=UPI00223EC5F9|nr:nucleotidyltransferase family protein [Sphingomicrobium nitratireducens]